MSGPYSEAILATKKFIEACRAAEREIEKFVTAWKEDEQHSQVRDYLCGWRGRP